MSTATLPRGRAGLAVLRVAIYCRISEDPRKKEEGVERQRKDGEALASMRGMEVVGLYSDNDISALSGAHRPEYERLLADVRAGRVDHVIAYGLARLWRNRRERADAIELFGRKRVSVTLVRGGEIDLSSAAGRAVAGFLGEVDTMESEIKAERVARAALGRAEEGRANAHVAYGWRREYQRDMTGKVLAWRDVEDPVHAAVVREIVDWLLEGTSIKAVCAKLNAREGLLPPRAALRALAGRPTGGVHKVADRWQPSTVRKLALRDANVARRVRGEYEGKRRLSSAVLGDASWPPIVDAGKHERVVALLTDPSRVKSRSGSRKHLLSYGIGDCGVCGAYLRHRVLKARKSRHADSVMYGCISPAGCTHRDLGKVERLLATVVVARLARPDTADLLTRNDDEARVARERSATLRAKLAQVQDDYDNDVSTREMYLRSTKRLRAELAEAEEEAMRNVHGVAPELLDRLAGPHAAEEWEALTVTEKRTLLQAMGVRVSLMPTRRGPVWRPEDVHITFADGAERAAA